ncbi:hypothetical protein STRAU_7636 [Streptomyces aurantiacus JA 4570]|uniref:Uncharacterized protein n=1 Tax=Streptomyces aurantiacus JA 4570 TaxID=1286094 RepID=S3Z800_9ACTN|nr:hypothetical protein STRAU_7636 [Streptomyces aurantiacus JA 4570]
MVGRARRLVRAAPPAALAPARGPGRCSRRQAPPDRAVLSYPGRPREQLGLGFVQLGLHCPLTPVARRCVT